MLQTQHRDRAKRKTVAFRVPARGKLGVQLVDFLRVCEERVDRAEMPVSEFFFLFFSFFFLFWFLFSSVSICIYELASFFYFLLLLSSFLLWFLLRSIHPGFVTPFFVFIPPRVPLCALIGDYMSYFLDI